MFFWFLVWCSFILDVLGKITPSITSICSTIWEEADGTSSLTTQCQNVYTFWWDMFCNWCINQLPLFNTSYFLFPQALFFLSTSLLFNLNLSTLSLLISFIITCHTWFSSFSNLLTTSICFQVLMLWILVTMYKTKFTYERHWWCLLHKIHKQIELLKWGIQGLSKNGEWVFIFFKL